MKYKLNELCEITSSKRIFANEYTSSGIPFYRGLEITQLSNGNIISNELFISKEKYKSIQYKYGVPQEDDLFITAVGTIGSVYMSDGRSFYFKDGNVIWLRNYNVQKINPAFLRYYLKSDYIKKQIDNRLIGAVQKALTIDTLSDLYLDIPKTDEQLRITNILGSLDKKIEINQKKIAELEELAKLINDYWFVQFDFPDENGKPYKSSGGKMLYNERIKRDIPFGWKVYKLKDCLESINTGLNPRDNFVLNDGANYYITVKNITETGAIDFKGCDRISNTTMDIINNRSKLEKDDILYASISPLGRVYFVNEKPSNWEINESVFALKCKKDIITPAYLYMFLKDTSTTRTFELAATGSIFKGIRIAVLNDASIIVPDEIGRASCRERV